MARIGSGGTITSSGNETHPEGTGATTSTSHSTSSHGSGMAVSTDVGTSQSGANQLGNAIQDTTQLKSDSQTAGEKLTTKGSFSKPVGHMAQEQASNSRKIKENMVQNEGMGTEALGAKGTTGALTDVGTNTAGNGDEKTADGSDGNAAAANGTGGAAGGGGGGGCGGGAAADNATGGDTGGAVNTNSGTSTAGTAGKVATALQGGDAENG